MSGIFLGYPKCGSTTIQQWLGQHPQIEYQAHVATRPAETAGKLTVIGDEGLSIPFPSFAQLSESDVDAVIPAMRDGQALFAKQREVCLQLAAKYPEARVLLVTRGASGIMRSIYLNYLKFGGTRSFEQYTSECEQYFRTWLDYDFLAGLYQQHFGPDKVLTLPAELLFANPTYFWRLVEVFWGLEHFANGPTVAFNQALYDFSAPVLRRVSSVVKTILRPFPADGSTTIKCG